jgi:hypothetical protein
MIGKYTAGKETLDGAPTYSNSNDLSIFRNKGFWYIGNLAPWPPVTAYRCVEQQGCNYMEGISCKTIFYLFLNVADSNECMIVATYI